MQDASQQTDLINEAILQAILKTAIDAIITIDRRGFIRHVNPAACEMFGYPVSELQGKNISLLMPSPYREEHDGYLSNYLQTGEAKIIGIGREVTALRSDGSTLEVDLAVSKIHVGSEILFTGIVRDMTARKQAEAAASLQRSFADNLVDTANALILVLNREGEIVRTNPYLEELCGYGNTDLLGQDWIQTFLSVEEREESQKLFDSVLSGHPVDGVVSHMITKSGKSRTVTWSCRALSGTETGPDGILMIGSDITELKQAEAQLIASERLAAIGQMVTGLAHESRNALQRARACLDVLELDAEEESRAMILRAQTALSELQRLYEEVRNYAAPLRLELTQCDLLKLCLQTWQNLEPMHSAKNIQLILNPQSVTDHDSSNWTGCVCDSARMEQVLRNIFENAIAVSPENASIQVTCRLIPESDSKHLELTIRDEGPGLTVEQAEQIFTPFFTTKTKGTGLGMAISKRIVETHGGTITTGPPNEKGAEIRFTIPIHC